MTRENMITLRRWQTSILRQSKYNPIANVYSVHVLNIPLSMQIPFKKRELPVS